MMLSSLRGAGRRSGGWHRRGRTRLYLLLIILSVGGAPCGADINTCTIDGQPVLLYKITQWWYDAPTADSPWICGRTLACRTREAIDIRYAPEGRRLTLRFDKAFAELVSAGPAGTALNTSWVNPDYFDAVTAHLCPVPANPLGRLCIDAVRPGQASRLTAMADHLEVILSGPVRGLAGDRIALFHGQGLLKTCPTNTSASKDLQPVTLTLRQRHIDTVLAIFLLQPADVGP